MCDLGGNHQVRCGCFFGHGKCNEGREAAPDMATSPRRQAQAGSGVRPKEPPSMVVQGDFRKVSGISTEIFRQIETVENDHDATTAAALEVVERRGEMVVRMLDPRHMGAAATDAAKKFLMMQDQKHFVHFVEIVKRPGQTLGLYIREGNGLDRCDGVFISRIALESAVYNSGCLKVGDEILAVNLVDVTRMSLDDVVIIMSIPRRLVLTTRQRKSQKGVPSPHLHRTEQKPPPVVVIKKELEEEPVDESTSNGENGMPMMKPPPQRMQQYREPPSRMPHRRSPLDEADLYQEEQYLYYNSRPEHTYRPPSRSHEEAWSYQPPPPVITEQPKPSLPQHFQPYDRGYPKTLESLAEKVHTFYGGPAPPRRAAQPMTSTRLLTPGARPRVPPRGRILRSGSDQHLPRTEHDLYEYVMRPLRSSMKASTMQYPVSGRYADTMQRLGALRRRTPSLDYASDTEATTSGRTSYLLSMTRPYASLRSNSLPRDHRGRHRHMVRFEREPGMLDSQEDSDGAVSAPELPTTRRERGRLPSSPSVFTADEYRAWLQRTPSTSAIYERIRQSRDVLQAQRAARFTYSAENLLDRAREEQPYYSYRSHLSSTLDRPFSARSLRMEPLAASRSSSMRRMRHLLEEGRHIPNPSPTRSADPRVRLLDINPAEFLKYKMDKSMISSGQPGSVGLEPGVSGLLWVHLLAGRGLKSTTRSEHYRDLYCVLECDRVHKARTVVRTGDLIFDWDETFELDLINNHELDFLIYSWDPQYRHKLCYKGSIHLVSLLRESPMHQLALKIEPRGTLYLKLRYTDPRQTFLRTPNPRKSALFGVDLETVVGREGVTGGVPGGVATSVTAATPSLSVPILVKRCVEEVERRGLDIIGLYRLCGSATKKRALREAFERNPRTVDLSPDNVPDINVITGVLKDYLRELPEPLFTKCLYQMLVDALSVCLPDDPEGNAKLMFSILDCLPKVNRSTLVFLMDHLSLVVSQSDRNKMAPQNLAVCFGPVLMLQSEEGREQDFHRPISVLKYLLEIWPNKSDITA